MGDGPDDALWIVNDAEQAYDWRCIAMVCTDTGKEQASAAIYRRDRDANARLIAAAPEFFEAILQYRDDLKYPPDQDSADRRREWVEALVAKVIGQ